MGKLLTDRGWVDTSTGKPVDPPAPDDLPFDPETGEVNEIRVLKGLLRSDSCDYGGFQTSRETDQLFPALRDAWAKMDAAPADSTGQIQSRTFGYSSHGAVIGAVKDTLLEFGLMVIQGSGADVRENHVIVTTTTQIRHVASGQWVGMSLPLPASMDPQSVGKAIGYAKRYGLAELTGLVTGGDLDQPSGSNGSSAAHPRGDSALLPDGLPPGEAVVQFGNNKGEKLRDLDQDDLKFHIKAARTQCEDPAKARWREPNEAWRRAVQMEVKRRQDIVAAQGEDEPPIGEPLL